VPIIQTDPKTNNPSFVRVDEDELATMPNIKLYPGMPATGKITAFWFRSVADTQSCPEAKFCDRTVIAS
jgi:hypothetical protein